MVGDGGVAEQSLCVKIETKIETKFGVHKQSFFSTLGASRQFVGSAGEEK